uniref:Uncharacterized protein n=1 Tax=Nelumbo nucifera TaxID=4432 RepID=A0A822ZBJ8_NELNU|nr:TPA_asm: hypothetical protein HUJ06_013240 [Nelumbo nucifera]
MGRHLKSCIPRKVALKAKKQHKQQMTLNFQPIDSNVDVEIVGPTLLDPIVATKCDHSKMREAIAHWVLMHEHPFTIVEEEGFIFMMKMCNPSFEKISRKKLKNGYVAVYEDQKKKLKNILKDANWRLQKRVLSFVHVPPPCRGVDIADAIYKCLKEWGLKKKVFTVFVDNASYNDSCLRFLREIFYRNRKLLCDGKLFHL